MAQPALNVVSEPFYADALSVAQLMQPEEAVFCFSAESLKARLAQFTAGFPGTVSFAVKSNPSKEVATALAAAGLQHWDVASVQEMTLTFVPKVGAMLIVFWVSMSFMTTTLVAFFTQTVIPLIAGS